MHPMILPSEAQEARAQVRLSGPLAANYCLNIAQVFISLAVIGQLGTQALAAASIALHAYNVFVKMPLLALNGALDTQASQVPSNVSSTGLARVLQAVLLLMVGWPRVLLQLYPPSAALLLSF